MDSFKEYYQKLSGALEQLPSQFDELQRVSQMLSTSKQIVCIGVGKSGYVAQKLDASLASISLNSIYLHPSEALHGDVGVVNEGAIVVVFSKSGNSREVNDLLPLLKKRSCCIVAVCNRKESYLGISSDIILDIMTSHEGEPLNILPLISIDISMVIANMLIARVSEICGLTLEAFARNHPNGQLGRNISLRLSDLSEWKSRRPFIDPSTSIIDAIMVDSENRAGLVCLMDASGELIGVVSDGDIRRAVRDGYELSTEPIARIMNKNPISLKKDMLIGTALDLMEGKEKKVFSAPVLDFDGRCEGVVTLHDLIGK